MDEGAWEAARAVRPYLVELLGSAGAADVDAALARLLTGGAGGEDVEGRLRAVLEAHEATSVFLERVLADAPAFRPPRVVSAHRRRYSPLPGYSRLPGPPSPVPSDKFGCPHGDYVWYRPEVGTPVPLCPTDCCALEPV